MNCAEFKQCLLIDPYHLDQGCQKHLQSCTHCQQHYDQFIAFEQSLKAGLQEQTDPDDALHNRLNQHFLTSRNQRRRKRMLISMAAGLFFLVVGVVFVQHGLHQQRLPSFVLAHIDHEFEQLKNKMVLSQTELGHYFSSYDSDYLSALKTVTYIEECWMRTGYGLHLIFQGEQGPVTFLLMPNEPVDQAMEVVSESFQGRVYPFGSGSMAIVGYPGESVERVAEMLRMAKKHPEHQI